MKALTKVFTIVKNESPILYWIVMILFAGAVGSVVGLVIDQRHLMGVNVWLKPLKFFISTAVYVLTVGFLVTLYPFSKLKKHIIRNLVSWTLLLEMAIVALQAARGIQSHYNKTDITNELLFAAMGILIAINVLIMIFMAFETIRVKLKTVKSLQWAILLGWLITIYGSYVGGTMIGQMAHNVGVVDGGPGLPLFNWSTIAGDLRVGHFFGLHALQIIPVFAYVSYKTLNINHKQQVAIITLFATAYTCFMTYTFIQALNGIPFLR
ncbi:MAG: hypothetical protein HKN99_11005 [Winogradskyella sp.]|nr:hypothetical protein [Winogradskyella sp.]MBT8376629.1 hypothetical protein [Bacteroidia bacterium]NNC46400.1 hypothetical protein [Winogradskyella sp.]NNF86074.1 hypothetical protein [Winogradskyella sp.]NNK40717.1 hypothetical protein [Winogradskyella sp.]